MKKIYITAIIPILTSALIVSCFLSLGGGFIGFRVIAESDSPSDQLMKIKLKNEMLSVIKKDIGAVPGREEAIFYLESRSEYLKSRAEAYLKSLGYERPVHIAFSDRFGKFRITNGKYRCFEVRIGSAKGKNIFCVMFPSVAFKEMADCRGGTDDKKIIYRFKLLQLLKKGE